jgi:surface protein
MASQRTLQLGLPSMIMRLLVAILAFGWTAVVTAQPYRCFEFNETTLLRNAIANYIATAPPKPLTATSARIVYGPVIGNWCVDRLVSFQGVFQGRTSFNEPLTNWNTSSATNMQQMFQDAFNFNQPLDHFDVSRVTNMNRMFQAAVSFTGVGLETTCRTCSSTTLTSTRTCARGARG